MHPAHTSRPRDSIPALRGDRSAACRSAHPRATRAHDRTGGRGRRALRGPSRGITVLMSDAALHALERLRWTHGMSVWDGTSLHERAADAVHVGLKDLEHELAARGVVLHHPPAIDGLGTWRAGGLFAPVVQRAWRWRRGSRSGLLRYVSGVALPPSEQRRLGAVTRAFRRIDPARVPDRGALLQEALRRGIAALVSADVPPVSPSPFAPMMATIDLPRSWVRRLFGWIRLVDRRPLPLARRSRRRTTRRSRRARRSRGPPVRGTSADDDPPDGSSARSSPEVGRW
jgi:hypothetical protein